MFLSDKPVFADQAEALLEFLGDAPLVAHNASFDFGFLNHEMKLAGREPVCMTRMVDTLVIARARHPGAKHSLDALCSRYGVDRSHRVKHGALLDAQLLYQVYVELTGGRQIGLGLRAEGDALQSSGSIDIAPVGPRSVRIARPHAASEAEIARHGVFMAKIAKPLWARFVAPRSPGAPSDNRDAA